MRLILTRTQLGPTFTEGELSIERTHHYPGAVDFDGRHVGRSETRLHFLAFTIEDQDRGLSSGMSASEIARVKVPGETAIPIGEYAVVWAESPRLGRKTLRLVGVPGFDGILIHAGNSPEDSRGCILPGLTRDRNPGRVLRSREAVAQVEALVVPAIEAGEVVTLRVRRAA